MRNWMKLGVMAALAAGMGCVKARAQEDIGMVWAQQASDAANAFVQQQQQQSNQDFQNYMANLGSASSTDSSSTAAAEPAAPPKTSKPKIQVKRVAGSGATVTLSDRNNAALLFYTTDGSKPTLSSAKYVGPIAVTKKEKVRALAFDVAQRPSGVVGVTVKV